MFDSDELLDMAREIADIHTREVAEEVASSKAEEAVEAFWEGMREDLFTLTFSRNSIAWNTRTELGTTSRRSWRTWSMR